MNVVGHHDNVMQQVPAFATVVLECLQKHLRICSYLKYAASIERTAGNEEHSVLGRASRNRHAEIVSASSVAEAGDWVGLDATGEPVALNNTGKDLWLDT